MQVHIHTARDIGTAQQVRIGCCLNQIQARARKTPASMPSISWAGACPWLWMLQRSCTLFVRVLDGALSVNLT